MATFFKPFFQGAVCPTLNQLVFKAIIIMVVILYFSFWLSFSLASWLDPEAPSIVASSLVSQHMALMSGSNILVGRNVTLSEINLSKLNILHYYLILIIVSFLRFRHSWLSPTEPSAPHRDRLPFGRPSLFPLAH